MNRMTWQTGIVAVVALLAAACTTMGSGIGDTRVDDLAPLWAGWHRRWGGWNYWDAGPEFITHYSGRVLANLANAGGDHMRCNFQLVRPSSGMAGGGEGKCQLNGGRTIDATFPAA